MNTNNLKSVRQYSISTNKNALRTTKFRLSSSDFLLSRSSVLYFIFKALKVTIILTQFKIFIYSREIYIIPE